MAVIITNMDMPNRCDECPLSSLSNECPLLNIDCEEEMGGRDLNCPLKEVKECKAEDCISRQAVIDATGLSEWFDSSDDYNEFVVALEKLPPATPQEPKTGHWIEHDWEKMREKGYYRCSVCDYAYQRCIKEIRKSDVPYIDGQEYILWKIDHYCPNCGAKMVESQKSEDNNE